MPHFVRNNGADFKSYLLWFRSGSLSEDPAWTLKFQFKIPFNKNIKTDY